MPQSAWEWILLAVVVGLPCLVGAAAAAAIWPLVSSAESACRLRPRCSRTRPAPFVTAIVAIVLGGVDLVAAAEAGSNTVCGGS